MNPKAFLLLVVIAPCCDAILLQEAQAKDPNVSEWRWWRGPNSNGIAARGQSPPASWSDTENVLWKTRLTGRGHSSPTIVDGRIVLATADEAKQLQLVLCFDQATGRQLWSTVVNQGGLPQRIHRKNTHASSTVASDGERLFINFHNHDSIQAAALDLDGQLIWKKVVGPFKPQQYKYGYAASPLLYKSLVIITADFDGDAFLAALDRKTGEETWRTRRPGKMSWSTPVVANVAGRDQLLISGCEMVASYDPDTGQPLWSSKATTMATCGTMVWDGDLVYASGGYPDKGTYCIRADGSGEIVWENTKSCYEQSMLLHDGHVYAITDDGLAYCWQASDGTEKWKSRLGGKVSASPILADGNIYVSNENGTTFVFRADPRAFHLVARNQLGSASFATPTICDGKIYLRIARGDVAQRQEFLYCIGKDS